MERLFLPVSAESLFALEGFRAMQKFLPNTVPDFFDISYAEPTFHSSEKPQILSCSGLFTELFAKFFPQENLPDLLSQPSLQFD